MSGSLSRAIIAAILSALSLSAWGFDSLRFSSEAKRTIIVSGDKITPVTTQTSALTHSLGAIPKGAIVRVIDDETGNAAKFVNDGLKGSMNVLKTDFQYANQVDVLVTHEGKAVASGSVKIAGKTTQDVAMFSPSSKGKVTFNLIPLGEIKVWLETTVDGKPYKSPITVFNLELVRETAIAELKLAIADKVDVLEPTATTTSEKAPVEASKPAEAPKSSGPSFLSILFGLAVIGGLAYAFLRFFPQHRGKVDGVLAQHGLKLPDGADSAADPGDPNSDPPTSPQAPAQQPITPIILDPVAPVTPAASVASVPGKLGIVGPNGRVEVDRPIVIGREAPADYLLAGQSSVSRSHARIENTGSQLLITDLGSTNGTFVNGIKIQSPTVLNLGDVVQLGDVQLHIAEV